MVSVCNMPLDQPLRTGKDKALPMQIKKKNTHTHFTHANEVIRSEMCLMQSGILHCRCRRNGIKQAGRAAAQKATSLHYAKTACPLTHTECLTTVMPTIIIAVNINLHPASSGNITAIIHSYDRDNSAREGSKDRASYFLAAYYRGLFGA